MSLTRNQWLKMWSATKLIEHDALTIKSLNIQHLPAKDVHKRMNMILNEANTIKQLIQEVIGQMETNYDYEQKGKDSTKK